MVKFKFDLNGFVDIQEIHLTTIDKDGNKIDKIGLEDMQDQPTQLILEIKGKNAMKGKVNKP